MVKSSSETPLWSNSRFDGQRDKSDDLVAVGIAVDAESGRVVLRLLPIDYRVYEAPLAIASAPKLKPAAALSYNKPKPGPATKPGPGAKKRRCGVCTACGSSNCGKCAKCLGTHIA